MAVRVTHVRLSGGSGNEHISEVRWTSEATSKTDTSTRQAMVDYINEGGRAYVRGNGSTADVGVVDERPPYIRTHANGYWNDNLLALPRF